MRGMRVEGVGSVRAMVVDEDGFVSAAQWWDWLEGQLGMSLMKERVQCSRIFGRGRRRARARG